MRFIETTVFTRQIKGLLSDEEYRNLQVALMLRPDQGSMIRGSAGLRKVRWGMRGVGKRGGIRVIYYWHEATEEFYMLFAYGKNVQDDLSPKQLRILNRVVREEFR